MAHHYPRSMGGSGGSVANRPHFIGKPCDGNCGHVFVKRDYVIVEEVQVSWFRGDDDVHVYCETCWDKSGKPLNNARGCCGTRRNKPHKDGCVKAR